MPGLIGLVLLARLAAGPALPARAGEPTLDVTYAAVSGSHTALWVSKEAGLFERHGLRVQLIYLGGGQATKVLLAGSSPIISISGPAPVAAAVQGADTVIVATVLNTFIFSIMARPDLTKPEALKGHRVGISRFGAATDFALRYALRRWGLAPGRDVAILQVGGVPEILAALRQGAIDAGVLSSPSTLLARRAGFPELVDMGKLGIEYPGACIVTTRSFLQSQPQIIRAFLMAFAEGIHQVRTDRAFAERVIARYTKVTDPEVVAVTYDDFVRYARPIPRPTPAGVKLILEELAVREPRARELRAEALIDPGPIRALEEAGFFRALQGG